MIVVVAPIARIMREPAATDGSSSHIADTLGCTAAGRPPSMISAGSMINGGANDHPG